MIDRILLSTDRKTAYIIFFNRPVFTLYHWQGKVDEMVIEFLRTREVVDQEVTVTNYKEAV
jgi:hypothetical protein